MRAPALTARAGRVRLLLLDVDGVLTDGTITISGDGTEAKRFDIKDGAAIVWAQRLGIKVGLISARPSAVTTRRASELRIRIVVETSQPKIAAYDQLLRRLKLSDEDVAYMGDDLLDLPVLRRAGLALAPADAAAEVRRQVHHVTAAPGGRGAVREAVELILQAQGRWQPFLEEWTGGGTP
jgi:3-deoxy-D-manno-octulosonate 8-phosphate phosphatase (KDO 8-P phosphatase)